MTPTQVNLSGTPALAYPQPAQAVRARAQGQPTGVYPFSGATVAMDIAARHIILKSRQPVALPQKQAPEGHMRQKKRAASWQPAAMRAGACSFSNSSGQTRACNVQSSKCLSVNMTDA